MLSRPFMPQILIVSHPIFIATKGFFSFYICVYIDLSYIIYIYNLDGNKVMMEYIGATGILVTFNHVPISNSFDFHFILSFAIDADPSSNAQNDKFSPYWADTLTPDSIAALKACHHPNVVPNVVKALATLFSWSLGKKVLRWYDPKDPQLWISNAFKSLRSIITTYHLDGIDIDYKIFRKGNSTFAFCIRELISMLKNENLISVATIAPFYTTARP